MLDSHMQYTADQFAYVQGQITALSSQIDDLSVDHGSDSKSNQFQPFGHSSQKGGENFKGELAHCQGEHSSGLETLVLLVIGLLIFSFNSYNYWFLSTFFTSFWLKLQYNQHLTVSVYYQYVFCDYLNAFVAFSLYFQILLICLKYFVCFALVV